MRRFLPALLLALAGTLLAAWLVPAEKAEVARKIAAFPDADRLTHQLRPLVLAAVAFIPAIGALCYGFAGTLGRYATRQFVSLLVISFAALAVVWLLIDLQDNVPDMKQSGRLAATAAELYGARVPEILVTLLPYALLLSLLFTLGRLSASREIVAMIQTGRGLARLTTPFIVTGFLAALLCAGLNYYWAPRAAAEEKRILDAARGVDQTAAEFVQFRNPRAPRLWMVGSFPLDYQSGAPLRQIRVIEENPDGTLKHILTAESASWNMTTCVWTFHKPIAKRLIDGDAPQFVTNLPDPLHVTGWDETPDEIIQPGLPAAELGIPGLKTWLDSHPVGGSASRSTHLTQWHHRWAQPFNCVILVLIATPLGVVFTRRGTSGGVAVTVFLCAGLLFLTTISLSLGDAGYLPPFLAAWLPNFGFGALALYLFHRRLTGRPIYQTLRRLIPNAA